LNVRRAQQRLCRRLCEVYPLLGRTSRYTGCRASRIPVAQFGAPEPSSVPIAPKGRDQGPPRAQETQVSII
jgi:hypothetical protein